MLKEQVDSGIRLTNGFEKDQFVLGINYLKIFKPSKNAKR